MNTTTTIETTHAHATHNHAPGACWCGLGPYDTEDQRRADDVKRAAEMATATTVGACPCGRFVRID